MKYYFLLFSCIISLTAMESEKNDLPRKLTDEDRNFFFNISREDLDSVEDYIKKNENNGTLHNLYIGNKRTPLLTLMEIKLKFINPKIFELLCKHTLVSPKEFFEFFWILEDQGVNSDNTISLLKSLMKAHPDINSIHHAINQYTALHYLATTPAEPAYEDHYAALLATFLTHKPAILYDEYPRSPLCYAAMESNPIGLKMLLRYADQQAPEHFEKATSTFRSYTWNQGNATSTHIELYCPLRATLASTNETLRKMGQRYVEIRDLFKKPITVFSHEGKDEKQLPIEVAKLLAIKALLLV